MTKQAPNFWWDTIDTPSAIIVQSDYPGGERLAIFESVNTHPDMSLQIRQAEDIIADFTAGRKTPKWSSNKSKSIRRLNAR